MAKRPNLYVLLGILRSASQEEIRHAYLKAVKKLHPDKNGPGATEMFLDVQEAYETLADPDRRAAYDATLPKEKENESSIPFNCEVVLSRSYVPRMRDTQLVYALVKLAPSVEFGQQVIAPTLNVCLAIDCSTSMKGEKLDIVKSTAIALLRKLRPQDFFSVVTFSDRAEVLIPATRQVDIRRSEIKIQMLNTYGGTEILRGLEAAYREVQQYASSKYVNHIILLTDGQTYGDEEACYHLADLAIKNNIGITGMGLGAEWNDVFLDQLSGIAGSSAIFVAQPQDIYRLLTEKFNKLGKVCAETVTFDYQLHADIELNYAFRLSPNSNALPIETPIQFGSILRDEPFSLLMELRILPKAILKARSVSVLSGHIKILAANLSSPVPLIPINIAMPVSTEISQDSPPDVIVKALSKLTLYRMQERARLEVNEGKFEEAAEHLKTLATRLLAQGERALAQTVLLEAENITQKKAFSENGEKQLKYGTRSLLMPGNMPK